MLTVLSVEMIRTKDCNVKECDKISDYNYGLMLFLL